MDWQQLRFKLDEYQERRLFFIRLCHFACIENIVVNSLSKFSKYYYQMEGDIIDDSLSSYNIIIEGRVQNINH